MGFFSNATINRLNIHSGFNAGLWMLSDMLAPIYLYQQGLRLAEIFLVAAGFNLVRMLARPLMPFLIHRFGLNGALVAGYTLTALGVLLLLLVEGLDIWLLLHLVLFASGQALYWTSVHAFHSLAGDAEHRGKQIAIRNSMQMLVSAVVPLLSGWMAVMWGEKAYLWLVLPLLIAGLWPLLGCQVPAVSMRWSKAGQGHWKSYGSLLHVLTAAAGRIVQLVWALVLLFATDSMLEVGAWLALGVIAQVVWQLLLGAGADRTPPLRATHMFLLLNIALAILMAMVPLHMGTLLIIEILLGLISLYAGTLFSCCIYNDSQKSAEPMWYWFYAEYAWDLGSMAFCLFGAAWLWAEMPLRDLAWALIPATAACCCVLRRYFKRHHHTVQLVATTSDPVP